MKLVDALNELKAAGITRLVGMGNTSDIDLYIAHAEANHANAVKYAAEGVKTWQYTLDHEDDYRLIGLSDGHYIITDRYGDTEMPIYSDYATEDEMHAAFKAYQIAEQAEAIADKMEVKRPGGLPRAVWVAIATAELKSAYAATDAAFARDFGAD